MNDNDKTRGISLAEALAKSQRGGKGVQMMAVPKELTGLMWRLVDANTPNAEIVKVLEAEKAKLREEYRARGEEPSW
jgi:hypothetical protein